MMVINGHYHEKLDAGEGRRAARRAEVSDGAPWHTPTRHGPGRPRPAGAQVVYTTLHFDKPWSYENYLKTGGYSALRKILDEKIPPRAGDRDGQAVRPARPRRRGLPDRPEVELHAAQRAGPEVHPVQLRRIRAGHLQGPRHPALQPACGDRGHGDRLLRDRFARWPTTTCAASSTTSPSSISKQALKEAYAARLAGQEHPGLAASTSTSTPRSAPAPTSAAKKPR